MSSKGRSPTTPPKSNIETQKVDVAPQSTESRDISEKALLNRDAVLSIMGMGISLLSMLIALVSTGIAYKALDIQNQQWRKSNAALIIVQNPFMSPLAELSFDEFKKTNFGYYPLIGVTGGGLGEPESMDVNKLEVLSCVVGTDPQMGNMITGPAKTMEQLRFFAQFNHTKINNKYIKAYYNFKFTIKNTGQTVANNVNASFKVMIGDTVTSETQAPVFSLTHDEQHYGYFYLTYPLNHRLPANLKVIFNVKYQDIEGNSLRLIKPYVFDTANLCFMDAPG